MAKPNSFDVMKLIAERNGDIQIAPLTNIVRMYKTNKGAELVIGVPYGFLLRLMQDEFQGGLVLVGREEFARVSNEMEQITPPAGQQGAPQAGSPKAGVMKARVGKAFDAIGKANTISILSLDEMEQVVLRALRGEFD